MRYDNNRDCDDDVLMCDSGMWWVNHLEAEKRRTRRGRRIKTASRRQKIIECVRRFGAGHGSRRNSLILNWLVTH